MFLQQLAQYCIMKNNQTEMEVINMSFDRSAVMNLAEKYESFYLYEESGILESIEQLRRNFEGVRFLYSAKANPHPGVIKCILSEGIGVDAASLREVMMGRENGLGKRDIYYSAPGKNLHDIDAALEECVIIADSVNEVVRIQSLAASHGIVAEIGIRINPNFTFDGDVGFANKFGIDEDTVFNCIDEWRSMKNIKIIGIHVHSRSQELDGALIAGYYAKMFELSCRFQEALGAELEFVNMGSGIGIPYAESDKPVDLAFLGGEMTRLIELYRGRLKNTQILVETGRFLVGKAGVYVTHVLDKKVSHGKTFVLLSNTLNGFARPSIAQMVESYTDAERPANSEPMYTGRGAFGFVPLVDSEETQTVTVTGNLCTGTDVIVKDITLPKLDCGDVFVITNAGSYAAVLSPMQFASLTPPVQIFLKTDGSTVIR